MVLAGDITASPEGGTFLAVAGDPAINPNNTISQTLTSLHVGDNYAVEFYQAVAEQTAATTATIEQWMVSLGGVTQSSALMQDAAASFTGGSQQTLVFKASATTELLSFLASTGPARAPPFVLLDGVSAADVPELASLAALGAGALALLLARRRVMSGHR